jgi:hypothetical protein
MMAFLIQLLLVLLVLTIVYWIVTLIPLPGPFRNIALIVVLLIFLCWLLGYVGVFPSMRFRSSLDHRESVAVVQPIAMRLSPDGSRVSELTIVASGFKPGVVGHFLATRDLTAVAAPAETHSPIRAPFALL